MYTNNLFDKNLAAEFFFELLYNNNITAIIGINVMPDGCMVFLSNRIPDKSIIRIAKKEKMLGVLNLILFLSINTTNEPQISSHTLVVGRKKFVTKDSWIKEKFCSINGFSILKFPII